MKSYNIFLTILFILCLFSYSCKKETGIHLKYYQVKINTNVTDWRDSSFIVATSNPQLISEINAQLMLPVDQRKMPLGTLLANNGGYNKNARHSFKWHFKEDDWKLVDASAEIFDGKPYTDVDRNIKYWLDTVKRLAPWQSYISKEIIP